MHQSDSKTKESLYPGLGEGMDRLSSFYDLFTKLLSFGKVHKSQIKALSLVQGARRIAVIGGGSGWILAHIEQNFPKAEIHFIELSENMLERAKKHAKPNIKFSLGSEESLEGNYDLIILPFILNCLNETQILQLGASILEHCKHSSGLLVVDFNPELRSFWKKTYLKILYVGYRLLVPIKNRQLINYLELLEQLGLEEKKKMGGEASLYRGSLLSQKEKHKSR